MSDQHDGTRVSPALDLQFPVDAADLPDLVSVTLDDLAPTAIHEMGTDAAPSWRVFFASADLRNAARAALGIAHPVLAITTVDVPDEDWAARSQAHLRAVRVGRIVVAPPWDVRPAAAPDAPHEPGAPDASRAHGDPSATWAPGAPHAPIAFEGPGAPVDVVIVIQPSMGFGTGHHETTRLCLELLQEVDCRGLRVLDVGTGSGVLAIAAAALGARAIEGIDFDPDAIACATENLELNAGVLTTSNPFGAQAPVVRFEVGDMRDAREAADLVLANLTGGLLVASSAALLALVRPGGRLIVSGFQTHETEAVLAAVADGHHVESRRREGDWEAALVRCSS